MGNECPIPSLLRSANEDSPRAPKDAVRWPAKVATSTPSATVPSCADVPSVVKKFAVNVTILANVWLNSSSFSLRNTRRTATDSLYGANFPDGPHMGNIGRWPKKWNYNPKMGKRRCTPGKPGFPYPLGAAQIRRFGDCAYRIVGIFLSSSVHRRCHRGG